MNSATNLPAIEAIVIGASAGGVEAPLNILGRLPVELERIAC
ncbi:hypothetical protein PS938_01858 [Pseudomonas fluorescens]|uniref:CheB-type methylesterase domain-containing protein n=1 Tax=Pseudomonas fluorescens TaxID=294 RepID=A0A5E7TEG2_PSEFL|nr:hypothetical protein PS938_01858 [Pseudomonas fluorescens]